MYPIDVPHLARICTSHVPHSGPSVPHLGPDEMAALLTTHSPIHPRERELFDQISFYKKNCLKRSVRGKELFKQINSYQKSYYNRSVPIGLVNAKHGNFSTGMFSTEC